MHPAKMAEVPAEILITDTTTGETRTYLDPYVDPDADYPFYIYEDGNYSCDCNRALFFARALDPNDEGPEHACGHTRFSVKIRINGEIVYEE